MLKSVKKLLLIVAVLSCVVVAGLFITISNSNPLSGLDDYERKTDISMSLESNQDPGEQNEGDSRSGASKLNADLEKDIVNDRHKQIALKYKSQFARLQSQYQGKLNNMLESAKADLERVKNNESKTSVVKLAYTYLKRGKALEDECDGRFYSLLDDMEDELRREKLPLDLVNEAEREYKAQKKQRREHLLSIAREYIKGKN